MRTDAGVNRLQDGRAGRIALLMASALNAVAAIYHIIGGTPEVMYPVYSANLPPASAGVLDILWYQMAALIAGGAVATLVAAFRSDWRWPVAWIIGGHFLVVSGICLFFTFVWFGNPWGLIQWAIFGPAASSYFGRPPGRRKAEPALQAFETTHFRTESRYTLSWKCPSFGRRDEA
ncbi:hypothetical protein [Sinorhizobium meliloti]|uniref:hypothetical protein n=1 Tax=Rhizobium meliloti TaxID=382 RepID=UPI001F3EBAD9|nr:hypothetical protein [Sinorhizobium meliloti]